MEFDENTVCLDLANKSIDNFPESMLQCTNVRMLCLEGNILQMLPDALFTTMPNLTWLDLRNNKLKIVSSKISNCKCLETLLLQNNCIQQLPMELGMMDCLKTLHVSGNPIIYPSPDVLSLGINGIKNFLLSEYETSCCPNVMETLPLGKPITQKKKLRRRKGLPQKKIFNQENLLQLRRSRSVVNSKPTLPIISVKGYKSASENVHSITPVKDRSVSRRSGNSRKKINHDNIPPAISIKIDNQNRDRGDNSATTNSTPRKSLKVKQPVRNSERYVGLPQVDRNELREKEQSLKQLWATKLRQLLEKQASVLQRQKTIEALKKWRQQVGKYRDRSIFNYENNLDQVPYDIDPEFIQMLSRTDLNKLNATYDKRTKLISKPRKKVDISSKIDEIIKSINCLENLQKSALSPQQEQKLLEREILRLSEIQKTLSKLQCINEQEF